MLNVSHRYSYVMESADRRSIIASGWGINYLKYVDRYCIDRVNTLQPSDYKVYVNTSTSESVVQSVPRGDSKYRRVNTLAKHTSIIGELGLSNSLIVRTSGRSCVCRRSADANLILVDYTLDWTRPKTSCS